jgi:hypothetical protein
MAAHGRLGSIRFRRALVGRQLNEKFDLRGTQNPADDVVPLYGIHYPEPYNELLKFQGTQSGNGAWAGPMSPPEWPVVPIPAPRNVPDVVAHVEVLEACEAKLYRREAVLTQWGIVIRWAQGSPRTLRKGTLGWSMIDAQCDGGRNRLKIQAGPFYDADSSQGSARELVSWSESYTSLRSPSEHPEEWLVERARPGLE